MRHDSTGRQIDPKTIDPKTAESRQVYGESDPPVMACSSSLAYGTVVSPRTMTAAGATQPELCFPVASAGDDGLHSSCDATECSRIGADGLRGPVELCEVSAVRAANYGAVLVLAERTGKAWSALCVVLRSLLAPDYLRPRTPPGRSWTGQAVPSRDCRPPSCGSPTADLPHCGDSSRKGPH